MCKPTEVRRETRDVHLAGAIRVPRFREEVIAERLGHRLREVSIPAEVARQIEVSLQQFQVQMQNQSAQEQARLERELAHIQRHVDTAYMDKPDGKITDDYRQRRQAEGTKEELRIESLISGLQENKAGEKLLTMQGILELAQNAHSLYLTRKPLEQAELLKTYYRTAQLTPQVFTLHIERPSI